MAELSVNKSLFYETAKRFVDIVCSVIILIIFLPVIIAVALIIRVDSEGPIFADTPERVGKDGKPFKMYKFRSMVQNAHELLREDPEYAKLYDRYKKGSYKLKNDPRITQVGQFIRKHSLDEVPQLFNVVRGEMSLVGPRPPLTYEFEAYDHWQFDRLTVPPGITGLWQVSGRNLLTYRQMCELDLEYVHGWSLWLDVKILFKTVPVVLFNSGGAA